MACPLNEVEAKSPKMEASGSDSPKVLLLGEAPGRNEDEQNEPFVGKSGKFLRKTLRNYCRDRDIGSYSQWFKTTFRLSNCVRTRPPENKTPGFLEIECCRPSVIRDIESTKPKAIFGFGGITLNWAIKQSKISEWRGRRIPIKIGNHVCWFYPMFHPSYIVRGNEGTELERVFRDDLFEALDEIDEIDNAKVQDISKINIGIKCLTGRRGRRDIEALKKHLDWCSRQPDVSIDIETRSNAVDWRKFRPYGKGTRILTVAIGTYKNVVAFPLRHSGSQWSESETDQVNKIFYSFLLKAKCIKVAHHLGFEMEWLLYFYGKKILRSGRWSDTMAQAYCLDERVGVLSLDKLCLVHFGFNLKALSNVDVANLDSEPLEDVLLYNGRDAKYDHKLFVRQKRLIETEGLESPYNDHLRRIPTMVLAQARGADVDKNEVLRHHKSLGKRIAKVVLKIKSLKAVRKFEKQYGEFNPASPDHAAIVFRDILKRPEGKLKGGGYSTKEAVLEKIDHELARLLLILRPLAKVKSTYIDGLIGHSKYVWPDGKIHTIFNTLFVRTGRTSSESPNVQNYPKIENKEVRSVVCALKKHFLVSFDYGQLEFRVIGMCSKDKRLCQLLRERYDVHQEWAEKIVHIYPRIIGGIKFLKDKDEMGRMRQRTKNEFIFPLCFGANAPSISESLSIPQKKIEDLIEEFWDDFQEIKGWQESQLKFYEKNGYIECLNGRRRRKPLSFNKIINTPVQGSASDIVIEGMNKLSEVAIESGKSWYQAIFDLHDDLIFHIPDNRLEESIEFIISNMLMSDYSFVNVPLSVDVSVGKNWYELKKIGTFFSDDL